MTTLLIILIFIQTITPFLDDGREEQQDVIDWEKSEILEEEK